MSNSAGAGAGPWPNSGARRSPDPAAGNIDPGAEAAMADEDFADEAGVPSPGGLGQEEDSGGATAGGPGPGAGHEDPDLVAAAVAVVAKERDDLRDSLQRLQADFENYKKRVAKQQDDIRDRAAEALVEKLLPVLDTADLALAHGGGEDVKQMASSLFSMLEREGLERIDNAGDAFDPAHHDAVAHEPADPGESGDQEVAEVMRAGYRWRGRVIRAAMVKVRG